MRQRSQKNLSEKMNNSTVSAHSHKNEDRKNNNKLIEVDKHS